MIQKFKKKPVEIEAIQYTGKNDFEIGKWSNDLVYPSPVLEPSENNPSGSYLQIKTLEGVMTAIVGDWIIKGVKGEFYPCKPYIFEITYEDISMKEVAPDNDDWKSNRNFSDALRFLKLGEKMSRSGWNGKGMYVFYRKGIENVPISNEITANELGKAIGETMTIKPHFWIKNVDGTYSNWVPSINDLLSEDWEIVEL